MPKKTLSECFFSVSWAWSPLPPPPHDKIPGSAHDATVKSTVLDAQAHLCLLASNALHVVKILSPIINQKKVVKVGPLSGSAHAAEQLCFMLCGNAPRATQLLKQHVAWKRRIWSSCLRLILLADITKALIRMCGTQADLRLCWSHTTKSG